MSGWLLVYEKLVLSRFQIASVWNPTSMDFRLFSWKPSFRTHASSKCVWKPDKGSNLQTFCTISDIQTKVQIFLTILSGHRFQIPFVSENQNKQKFGFRKVSISDTYCTVKRRIRVWNKSLRLDFGTAMVPTCQNPNALA